MRFTSIRIITTCLLVLATVFCGSMPAFAETIENPGRIESSPVLVTGTVNALMISVTHPTRVEWVINANLATPFIAPELTIVNNTLCPINVDVVAFDKNNAGTLPFTDVAPDTFGNWALADKEQSLANIALGVKIRTTGSAWMAGYAEGIHWAAQSGTKFFGTLPKNSTGVFEFVAYHGLAFDTSYSACHDLTFMFTLN